MVAHSTQIIAFNWIANDNLIGDVDGINKDFELNYSPISEVIIRLNGLVAVPGNDKDYTISGTLVTFVKAPKIGNEIVASYFRQ